VICLIELDEGVYWLCGLSRWYSTCFL